MQGNKTHQQQIRIIEHQEGPNVAPAQPEGHESAPPASRAGLHQESRDHNKHNNPGQDGHGRQSHSPAEEKR
jgi:hypothetical protein